MITFREHDNRIADMLMKHFGEHKETFEGLVNPDPTEDASLACMAKFDFHFKADETDDRSHLIIEMVYLLSGTVAMRVQDGSSITACETSGDINSIREPILAFLKDVRGRCGEGYGYFTEPEFSQVFAATVAEKNEDGGFSEVLISVRPAGVEDSSPKPM